MSSNPAVRSRWAPAALGAAIAIATWTLAVVAWRSTHQLGLALSLAGLGVSLGPFLAAHRMASRSRKQAWRRAAMAGGALGILAFTLIDAVGLDMEAFFALLFLGTAGAAIGHTLVTTIVGPLLFGRLLCGWGCWRALVLEHLPVRESRFAAVMTTDEWIAALSTGVAPERDDIFGSAQRARRLETGLGWGRWMLGAMDLGAIGAGVQSARRAASGRLPRFPGTRR